MAKIDTTKITGYETMTPEEKLAALTDYEFEIPKPVDEQKYKDIISKANSEAAEYKRQLREKQTEQERQEAERLESEKQMKAELEGYKTRDRISNYQTKLIESGYDVETAKTMAQTLPDGIADGFFEAQKQFLATQRKNAEVAALNNQPALSVGVPLGSKDVVDDETAKLRKWAGL